MGKDRGRLDAVETIFFARELEKKKAASYDIKYPQYRQRELIPTSFDGGEGTRTITYEQYDSVGMAKIVHCYATDFPRVDVKGKEFSSSVKSLGASYGYNIQEIREARMANKPLEQRRANAAKEAIYRKEEKIAWFGDADANLLGFLTNPNVPLGTVANDGLGGLTTWESKSPQQIIRDVERCINAVEENTNNVEYVNTILFAPSRYNILKSMPLPNTTMTVLQFLKGNNPNVSFDKLFWLAASKYAPYTSRFSGDLMIAYNRSLDKLSLEIPVDFEQWAYDKQGGDYVTPCHERCGGVIWYSPLSAQIYEGI